MARYYYLLASFHDPALPTTLKNTSIEEVKEAMERNLSDKDKDFFNYLLYPNDCHNLIHVLFNREDDWRFPAVFDLDFLQKTKANRYDLPAFMQTFFEKPEAHSLLNKDSASISYSKASATQDLMTCFYEEVAGLGQDFIKRYFSFDHTISNLLAAINARVYPFSKKEELLDGEPYYLEILQSNDENFGLSGIFEQLPKWNEYILKDEQEKLERSIDAARIEYINTLLKGDAFTAGHVFGYYLKFRLLARWKPLTKEKGKKKLTKLIDVYAQQTMELSEMALS